MSDPTMTIHLDCAMWRCESLTIPVSATCHDLYIQVAQSTGMSCLLFRLVWRSETLRYIDTPLAEYNIGDHDRIHVFPNIHTGVNARDIREPDAIRQAIQDYAFSLPVPDVERFFSANLELRVRIPVGSSMGTLKFQLAKPLPPRALLEDEHGEISDVNLLHDITRPDQYTYHANFSGNYNFFSPSPLFSYNACV